MFEFCGIKMDYEGGWVELIKLTGQMKLSGKTGRNTAGVELCPSGKRMCWDPSHLLLRMWLYWELLLGQACQLARQKLEANGEA